MGPESWKDEVPREAGERERKGGEKRSPPREATDPREEEGYGQPESSAQKAPPLPRQGGERGDPSER